MSDILVVLFLDHVDHVVHGDPAHQPAVMIDHGDSHQVMVANKGAHLFLIQAGLDDDDVGDHDLADGLIRPRQQHLPVGHRPFQHTRLVHHENGKKIVQRDAFHVFSDILQGFGHRLTGDHPHHVRVHDAARRFLAVGE